MNTVNQAEQTDGSFIRQRISFEAKLPGGAGRWLVVREASGSGGSAAKHYSPAFLCVEIVDEDVMQRSRAAERQGRSTWTTRTPGVQSIFRGEFNAFGGRGAKSRFASVQRAALDARDGVLMADGRVQRHG
ncbi:hypothetical protein [Pseudomarimonas arenosa]|uniref:Uncharacterized protein n=1 Tax=Pseudomarimonas arenosa TaxID=2774145 RepID=A0AAW3ZSY8_9GAMM|nr:hypothetical protein [Pseudomarimonas arenosa]MBD8527276.1 hypothetical protein [Pseudomarimonas arenosa]